MRAVLSRECRKARGSRPDDSGESVIDSDSLLMDVTWEVHVPGWAPYPVQEVRRVTPLVVDPRDPTELWVDWDAADDLHVPAWDRASAVARSVTQRKGGIDAIASKVVSPLRPTSTRPTPGAWPSSRRACPPTPPAATPGSRATSNATSG